MNRYRYPLICLEEFVEAVTFAHYLYNQTLMTPSEAQHALPANIELTAPDYVFGVFDLTGEMMRFATSVTALTGNMPTSETPQKSSGEAQSENHGNEESGPKRTILADMHDVSSMLQICPTVGGKSNTYSKKLSIMIEQLRKVERLGYGLIVRGTERPKGWMPDLNEGYSGGGDGEDFGTAD